MLSRVGAVLNITSFQLLCTMFRQQKSQEIEGIRPNQLTYELSNLDAKKDEEAGFNIKGNVSSPDPVTSDTGDIVDKDTKGPEDIVDHLLANDPDEENSPIEDVRAVVSNRDDPDMPVNTFRAWFLGLLFVLIGSGVNEFFGFRYPR